jgi:hypothetical protein
VTTKDYVLIASVIRDTLAHNPFQRAIVAVRMADALKRDNPRCEDVRFIRACCPDIETGAINDTAAGVRQMRG